MLSDREWAWTCKNSNMATLKSDIYLNVVSYYVLSQESARKIKPVSGKELFFMNFPSCIYIYRVLIVYPFSLHRHSLSISMKSQLFVQYKYSLNHKGFFK